MVSAMSSDIEGQYTIGRLGDAIVDALRAAGHDPDQLDPEALAPVEEFHTLGRTATQALAAAAQITAADRVLDVGCGIGGPARFLARTFGCSVTGIDLSTEFVEVARDLNRRAGLADSVEVRRADALDLPFGHASFDVVWTQHVTMNIADKRALYREFARVLAPGGRLAFFDVVAGPTRPIHFPVPWADRPDRSFLEPADQIHTAVRAARFTVKHWEDLSDRALAWFTAMAAEPPAPAPLGLHLLIPDVRTKVVNLRRNLAEDRIRLQRCVATI